MARVVAQLSWPFDMLVKTRIGKEDTIAQMMLQAIPFKAAVELSYISAENQELLVELLKVNEYKCDINKARLIREQEEKGKLNASVMENILAG